MFCKKIYVHIKNICLTTIKYELYKKICAVKKYTKNVAKPTELLLALRPPPAHVAIAYSYTIYQLSNTTDYTAASCMSYCPTFLLLAAPYHLGCALSKLSGLQPMLARQASQQHSSFNVPAAAVHVRCRLSFLELD